MRACGLIAPVVFLAFVSSASVALAQQIGTTAIPGPTVAVGSGPSWTPGFAGPGTAGPVNAFGVWDDGRGDALYVGGLVSSAGGVSVGTIARYDGGGGWEALGVAPGGVGANVYAIQPLGAALYVGGWFTTAGGAGANYIAQWDGASWSPLGTGMSAPAGAAGVVDALTVFDDGGGAKLYAGGYFTTAGGVTVNRIARWNGSAWSALGSGMDARVRALAVYGGALYAAGEFTTAGGAPASRVAKWNGSSWSAVGGGVDGVNGTVLALAVHNGLLYVGGEFTTAGGATASRVASWNGSTWSALGSGTGGVQARVKSLASFGGALYVGGDFTTAGGIAAEKIARWDGASWSAVGSGATASVNALATFDAGSGVELFAGGAFYTIGGVYCRSIGSWDGAAWRATEPDDGVGGPVYAIERWDDGTGSALYVGGDFGRAGSVSADWIAKFQDGEWSPLGSGIDDFDDDDLVTVWDIAVFDDGTGEALYVAGYFWEVGGVLCNYVARWDGSQWSDLDGGMDDEVFALEVFADGSNGPELFAGGVFSTAGGVAANRIAKWDGAQWHPVGAGAAGGSVHSLAVHDDGNGEALFAGGNFGINGVAGTNNIARWNGTAWSALDNGVSGGGFPFVYALESYDDGSGRALYAGGRFTNAGSTALPVGRIARWNGLQWSDVGGGVGGATSPYVYDLEVFRERVDLAPMGSPVFQPVLIAVGQFAAAGGSSASRIARWDGVDWTPLDLGLTGSFGWEVENVRERRGHSLYVGGSFSKAGSAPATNLARWSSR